MTGEQLLAEVCAWLAETYPVGVKWFHSADPVKDRQPGFPDLVMAGNNGVLFAECKGSSEELSTEQMMWKWKLLAAGQLWHLWRPPDWDSGEIRRQISSIA